MILDPSADEAIWRAMRQPSLLLCAWCPEARERTIAARQAGVRVSHGLCPDCARRFEADAPTTTGLTSEIV